MTDRRWTNRTKVVMCLADQEAQRMNHTHVRMEHVLIGLAKEKTGIASVAFGDCGIDYNDLRRKMEEIIKSGPDVLRGSDLPLAAETKSFIELAVLKAQGLGHDYLDSKHFGLAFADRNEGFRGSTAYEILNRIGFDFGKYEKTLMGYVGRQDLIND